MYMYICFESEISFGSWLLHVVLWWSIYWTWCNPQHACNLQEARALLGRYEYQEGNIEAALHVFEGIDIASVTPKIKNFLAKSRERPKRRSRNYTTPLMSIHTAGLLLEAILLKAKCLQVLGRFKGTILIVWFIDLLFYLTCCMWLLINIFFLICVLRCSLFVLSSSSSDLFLLQAFDLTAIFLPYAECSLEVLPITVGYIIAFSIIFTNLIAHHLRW